MGELTKTNNAGKMSPGPIYNYKDEVKFNQVTTLSQPNLMSYSHPAGRLEPPTEPEGINPSMTTMRMPHS